MHIEDLLKLNVIRRSDSPHRSAAFIVRKHSEVVRGKSRMVINEYRITPGYRTHGKRMPTEVLDKKNLIDEGRILGKLAGPLYSKTSVKGQKYFNKEDIKLVKEIKEIVRNLPDLRLPLDTDNKII